MKLLIAESAGFCFGVKRAVDEVYKVAKEKKQPVYTLGQIIHNHEVTNQLESLGVKVVEEVSELRDDGIVVIRSHGVGSNVCDYLESNHFNYIDMTCPYVKKIHNIVNEYCEKGYQIIIVGDPEHPEVMGINGWCSNSAVIVNSLDDCKNIGFFDKICIVAQTTFSTEKWSPIRDYIISNCCKEYVEFCTICSATDARQKEIVSISKQADAVIVIGGKHSSNSRKLFEIAKSNCENSYFIETVNELDLNNIKKYNIIGITAGASTPKWIITEVLDKLSEIDKNNINDYESVDSFEEALKNSLKKVEVGSVVACEVMSIDDEEIIVNIGYKSDGIIPKSEYTNDTTINLNEIIKVGDIFDVIVIKNNDGEGNVVLSKLQLDLEKGWEKVENAYNSQFVILVKVISETKGGAIGIFESLKVFIPASQLSDKYVSSISEFIGRTIPARIIKIDERKNNIVVSSRVVLEESREKSKVSFWEGLHIGKDFIGKVKRIASFGAFVDLGGIDGLLHISEISWNKQDSPEKFMNVNDEIEVYVKEFDKEKEKVVLGLKNKPETPWSKVNDKYSGGDIVDGKVVKLLNFGAFVEIEEGVQGLVHISQISDKRLTKPDEMLEIGQLVKCKITSIDVDNRRMSLSIKEVSSINQKGQTNEIQEAPEEHNEDFEVTLGDALKIKHE